MYSNTLTVVCDKIPQSMTGLTAASVNPTNITISWSELTDMTANGGDIPSYYSLEYSGTTTSNNAFAPLYNDGVFRTSYMHVPGGIFTQTSVYYRLMPKNGVGVGAAYSAILTVTCDTKPTGMNTPVLV